MRKMIIAMAGLAIIAAGWPALAGPLRDRIRERMAERMGAGSNQGTTPGGVEMAYGRDPLQRMDVWKAKNTAAPLILFVHGGGWKRGDKGNATGAFKAPHFTAQGYAFASINYRLVPAATVEQQAADVAAAVAYVKTNAGALGVDARRIILMGHSAGAHLVALVGTDPRYLADAGLSFADIAGVIPLDGAAYDVPAQTKDGPQIMQATYAQAFGGDAARQKSLSPFHHATAPNAPAFLILHVDREDGTRQSEALGAALRAAGSPVKLARVDGKGLQGHMAINRRLGDPAYPATALVDDWLRGVLN